MAQGGASSPRLRRACVVLSCLIVGIALAVRASEVDGPGVLEAHEARRDPYMTPVTDSSGVACVIFTNNYRRYLKAEFLTSQLAHFEVSENRDSLPCSTRIYSTQMVSRRDYHYSASSTKQHDSGSYWTFESDRIRMKVTKDTLDVTLVDISSHSEWTMTTMSYDDLYGPSLKTVKQTQEDTAHVYGIGEEFVDPHGSSEGDWKTYPNPQFLIQDDHCGGKLGNKMQTWDCRATGIAQFPMGYYVKKDVTRAYGMFLDNQYYHDWNFGSEPMRVTSYGDHLRWFVMQGPELSTIRTAYMDLVGRPLVPNKRMFGLWVGKFGYRNFGGMFQDLSALRQATFPLDGLALDLFWFGGSFYGSSDGKTKMGSVSWDPNTFSNTSQNLAALKTPGGISVMLISESYISWGLPEFGAMKDAGYLAMLDGQASFLSYNPWWGTGGMIDWTNPDARAFWFDNKYCALLDGCSAPCTLCAGPKSDIAAWWNDLAEPEMFNCGQNYHGWTEDSDKVYNDEGSVHNLYGFLWAQSIYDGYIKNSVDRRPFQLVRSGAPGMQRFGGGMWSGDICGTLASLADHYDAQKHMSMVGMDYYCSDTAGYALGSNPPNRYETFTQWFMNEAWLGIPFRTHGDQFDQDMQCNPATVGDIWSNRFNARQRYELVPYYYSLAHMAHRYATPIIPPLFYHFQADPKAHGQGGVKMVGPSVLVGISTQETQTERGVYLPEGLWYNYHDHTAYYMDSGREVPRVSQLVRDRFDPSHTDPVLTLAAFGRAGGIIPRTRVSNTTLNVFTDNGNATDSSQVVRVYVDVRSDSKSTFTLYEDDGVTNAYLTNGVHTTPLTLSWDHSRRTVNFLIDESQGTYNSAPVERDTTVEVVIDTKVCSRPKAVGVTVQGEYVELDQAPLDQVLLGNSWAVGDLGNLFVIHINSVQVQYSKLFTLRCQ
eukprot:TRINITY_DN3951_c0_g1_i3.p1 TRINITY_DN3951_c0_g1~~TRINITY_DN3951_c0_g1_i3.p1  ORF type:complete len:934 (-),score=100.71 TRINITY_DN3951_c0_g1_i3:53-2854(-)